jgi:hypothetical protein
MGEKGNLGTAAAVGDVATTTYESSSTIITSAGEAAQDMTDRLVEKAQDRAVERTVDRTEQKLTGGGDDKPEV